MISINVIGGSVNTLVDSYYKIVALWFGICPICSRPYQHFGSYDRKTPRLLGPIFIQRVYCATCRISHALLPCFIIPYSRVLAVVREATIHGICFNTHTVEELAELLDVDPITVARWWRTFRQKTGVLMMALTEKLAQSSRLADWAGGSFQTDHGRGRKILELIGKCRATFSPNFKFCGFAWVNVFDPYLLFNRKGMPARNPGAPRTG